MEKAKRTGKVTKKTKIAALQMRAEIGDKNLNFQKVLDFTSKIDGVDIFVLPEVWNTGWNCEIFKENAEDINNSKTLNFLSKLAKEKSCNIIGGSFISIQNGEYYNTCPVFDRCGKLLALYNKNHLYSYYGCTEGQQVSAGKNPVIINIEGINYGLTICYDIRFPEIYRAYRKACADVFINCAAWANTKPIPWEMMTKSRAIENQTYMVAVNQYGQFSDTEYNLGHSRIIDYNGNVLSEILDGEGIISSVADIEEMYKFRDKCKIIDDIKDSYEVIKI